MVGSTDFFKIKQDTGKSSFYKTGDLQDSEAYQPEMELYSLLAHRRYPEQPTVTINIFFTEQDHYIQKHFSIAELQEATEQWEKKISALQGGNYNKNTDHCCACPYADPNGQCIITEHKEKNNEKIRTNHRSYHACLLFQ